jgi:ADP-ribosylglycohydrolase
MLGAVAGDIIGSPYEWNNTQDRYFELCRGTRGWFRGREVTFHPKFTDDTVMTLAVARWLMKDSTRSRSKLIEIMQSMGREYINSGFAPLFKRWLLNDDPKPNNSYGNGAAMRVSPVAMIADSLPEAIALARLTAEVSHAHPEGIKGAEAMAQAIWMARHGRTKDDIRFAMINDFGYDLEMPESEMVSLLAGCIKEPIIVNGEDTGGFFFRETGKIDSSCQNTVPAAIRAFLSGDSFEDTVRRAVAYGGDSDTIASMAGAIAAPFYGGVPEKISVMCNVYLNAELRSLMQSFESICLERRSSHPIKAEHKRDDSFKIIKSGTEKIYVAPSYRKDLINALKERFGEDARIIKPSEMPEVIKELSRQENDGTYLENPLPDVRTIYYQDGEFRTSATMTGDNLPSREARAESRKDFLEIHDYAVQVKEKLQQACGYTGEGSIHFANAYFPRIYTERVEIWKGDVFAGSVGIDPSHGLLKINQGGDFGPMEWYGNRTESVFNSVSIESIKESIGRFCLDEGIGIFDKNRTSNIRTANNDVAHSKDSRLLDIVNSQSTKISTGVKR